MKFPTNKMFTWKETFKSLFTTHSKLGVRVLWSRWDKSDAAFLLQLGIPHSVSANQNINIEVQQENYASSALCKKKGEITPELMAGLVAYCNLAKPVDIVRSTRTESRIGQYREGTIENADNPAVPRFRTA